MIENPHLSRSGSTESTAVGWTHCFTQKPTSQNGSSGNDLRLRTIPCAPMQAETTSLSMIRLTYSAWRVVLPLVRGNIAQRLSYP